MPPDQKPCVVCGKAVPLVVHVCPTCNGAWIVSHEWARAKRICPGPRATPASVGRLARCFADWVGERLAELVTDASVYGGTDAGRFRLVSLSLADLVGMLPPVKP